jgi:hypothetical protein
MSSRKLVGTALTQAARPGMRSLSTCTANDHNVRDRRFAALDMECAVQAIAAHDALACGAAFDRRVAYSGCGATDHRPLLLRIARHIAGLDRPPQPNAKSARKFRHGFLNGNTAVAERKSSIHLGRQPGAGPRGARSVPRGSARSRLGRKRSIDIGEHHRVVVGDRHMP